MSTFRSINLYDLFFIMFFSFIAINHILPLKLTYACLFGHFLPKVQPQGVA